MNWTLLVPGALVAPRLAPELARALDAPLLAAQLALARALPRPGGTAALLRAPPSTWAAHWSWLADYFGLDPESVSTAPYAWRSLGAAATDSAADCAGDAAADAPSVTAADTSGHAAGDTAADAASAPMDDAPWIAHCAPVHMAIARDHFVVSDLGQDPLQETEARELLDRANAVLAREPAGARAAGLPPLRLARRGGNWFLLSPEPLDLQTWQLDAVLGQSVQDRLPVGPAARRWRVLVNEIQMSWHASDSAAAREDGGLRAANALWLHGGGGARPLETRGAPVLRMAGADAEAAVARGWLQAGAHPGQGSAVPAATLAVCRALFTAHAHQAWESWLAAWPAVEARLAEELSAARQAGASRFDLVLCGAHGARSLALPLRPSWWHRLRRPVAAAAALERWLTEPAPASSSARAGTHGAGVSRLAAA